MQKLRKEPIVRPIKKEENKKSRQNIKKEETTSSNRVSAAAVSSPTKDCKKYWKIMEQVAESEMQLKVAQRENEEERMEFERDLHRKNMSLLDLKIKVQNLQIHLLEADSQAEH